MTSSLPLPPRPTRTAINVQLDDADNAFVNALCREYGRTKAAIVRAISADRRLQPSAPIPAKKGHAPRVLVR